MCSHVSNVSQANLKALAKLYLVVGMAATEKAVYSIHYCQLMEAQRRYAQDGVSGFIGAIRLWPWWTRDLLPSSKASSVHGLRCQRR